MKSSVKTRIIVTVEIDGSTYSEDWKLEDINKQCGKEAVMGLQGALRSKNISIIGEPKVTTMTIFET